MPRESRQQVTKRMAVQLVDIYPLPGISPYGHLHFDSDLVMSIRSNGIIEPITLTPRKAGGYYLLSGYRRCQAAAVIGMGTIRANVINCVSKRRAFEIYYQSNSQCVPVQTERKRPESGHISK
ncbi:ParB N-terminal domain-containing protein [Pseudoflavonifractor phocaeensis]|uniref:ParB N-terminal domain-containing protein n=1 Tax=Pseudoflavonifractor phocaeensis TaxID=1870988 RepID=UPI0035219A19